MHLLCIPLMPVHHGSVVLSVLHSASLHLYFRCMRFLCACFQIDNMSPEGAKVCTYYQLHSLPVIMVIHPRTGQRKKMWEGAVQPDKLLEVRRNHHGLLSGASALAFVSSAAPLSTRPFTCKPRGGNRCGWGAGGGGGGGKGEGRIVQPDKLLL